MSIMNNLKGKIEEVDDVISEFMNNPCCGEDENISKNRRQKND